MSDGFNEMKKSVNQEEYFIQDNVLLEERIKQLEDEVDLWKKRAYELKKYAPTEWCW